MRKIFVIIRNIQEELKKAQYDIHYKVIDAVHWVPQHRKRIFIVGFDKKQFDTKKSDFFNSNVQFDFEKDKKINF